MYYDTALSVIVSSYSGMPHKKISPHPYSTSSAIPEQTLDELVMWTFTVAEVH